MRNNISLQLTLPLLAALGFACPVLSPAVAHAAKLPGWGASIGAPYIDKDWCSGGNRRLYVGDFKGNGQDDALCHNTNSGWLGFDYSESATLGFWGTDWNANDGWCSASGERIYVGDFNGDGRDDLLCRVDTGFANAGRKRIDYADTNGEFQGTNWDTLDWPLADQDWCTAPGEEVFVGDFDGDGKDDLLCWVQPGFEHAGRKQIDYSEPPDTFWGTDWNSENEVGADQDWCSDAGSRLDVGDFNGNGSDDLLCHIRFGNPNAGSREVDLADLGKFHGGNWSSAGDPGADASWCGSSAQDYIRVGDVNFDGSDDLLCVRHDYGGVRVDHAEFGTVFRGDDGDAHWEFWCPSHADSHVGDFDGDGGTDVLCHDTFDGDRSIRYAGDDGDFFSLCSDLTTLGDGNLDPIPVYFAVLSDPDVQNRTRMPTATSTHDDPFVSIPSTFSQFGAPWTYFEKEIDVMNARTYPDTGVLDDVCFNDDCLFYEYDGHALFDQTSSTTCKHVIEYHNPASPLYASNCKSYPIAGCFPNECGANYSSWTKGSGCSIRTCDDPVIRRPDALTVLIFDRCDVDLNGVITGCGSTESWGYGLLQGGTTDWGLADFFTGWKYTRVLRDAYSGGLPNGDIATAVGVEQHELGHVFGLGHTADCTDNDGSPWQFENAMTKQQSGNVSCAGITEDPDNNPIEPRLGGYSYDISHHDGPPAGSGHVDQIEIMIDTARQQIQAMACH